MRIIHTDNFGGDYPDEVLVEGLPYFGNGEYGIAYAKRVADAINSGLGENASRYYKVVEDDYVLQPGFEP